MSTGRAAALLLAVAAALGLLVVVPFLRAASAASAEARSVREERDRLQQQLAEEERRAAREVQARERLQVHAAGDPVGSAREAVLAGIRDAPLDHVRLNVRGTTRRPHVHVRGTGGFEETMATLARLTGPGGGVLPARVELAWANGGLAVDLDGEALVTP